jgi:circadian clock protein KaiC
VKKRSKKIKMKKKSKKIKEVKGKLKHVRMGVAGRPLEKLRTGVAGLDALFDRGIPESSSVLIEGGPGSGKTILCLQIAYNMCKNGKRCLYMSFEEPEERLREHMRDFGWDPVPFEKKGILRIQRFSALDIARSVEALLSEAKKELLIGVEPILIPHEFKPDFVLIDSLTSIASAFSGEESRFRIYIEQLFRYLERSDITTFLIRETSNPTHIGTTFIEKSEAISFLSDGIISLYNAIYPGGKRYSAIEIVKMRGEGFKRKIVRMEIDHRGITIYPNQTLPPGYKLT